MDAFYIAIRDIFNLILPTAQQSTFGALNDFLAYVITITILYLTIGRPILKILGVKVR